MRKQMIVVSGFALVLALAACGKTNYNATSGNTKSTAKSNPGPTARPATPQTPPATAAARNMALRCRNCAGACAMTWPPLLLEAGAAAPVTGNGVQGPLSVIARPDGGRQVADNGHPLYRFSGDSKPGDTNGDGFGNVWHVVTIGTTSTPAAAPSGY